MITWLQTFFLKHNKVLFSALLVVIIMTFVLTIGNQSFFGSDSGPQARRMEFFGYNLASDRDMAAIMEGAELSAMLNPQMRLSRENLADYAYARIAAIGIANQTLIPGPTDPELEQFVRQKQVFQNEEGLFDSALYNRFISAMSISGRYSQESIARVLREDYRVERVREALGGPGFLLPFEALKTYEEEETIWSVAVAERPFADFQPELNPSEEELAAFYEQNPERYRVPEQIRLTALEFRAENFLDKVEAVDDEELIAYFESNRTQFIPDEAAETKDTPESNSETGDDASEAGAEAPAKTFADVRPQVLEAVVRERARPLAAQAADRFTVALWRQKIEKDSPAFEQLLGEMRATRRPLAPFARNRPPRNLQIPAQAWEGAWLLAGGSRYFSDLAETPDGAAVLLFEEIIPSRIRELEEVRGELLRDFTAQERRRLFVESGQQIAVQLREALAAGTGFSEAAEAQGLKVNRFENFAAREAPNPLRFSLFPQIKDLPAGDLSEMVFAGPSGQFAYITKKDIPEVALDSPEVQERYQSLRERLGEFDGWGMIQQIASEAMAVHQESVPQS